MPLRLVAGLAALALTGAAAAADGFDDRFLTCRAIGDPAARLACFDALPSPRPEFLAEFRGAGSKVTPAFDITSAALLSFTSDDAIFVAYLLDAQGAVVQNLHLGGATSGNFLIREPGRYSLQINASGGWHVELQASGGDQP